MERSGHLSKEGLRSYERTSGKQVKEACSATVKSKEKENDENMANVTESKPDVFLKQNETTNKPAISPSDYLKTLNFQAVHGGVFNINLNNK